MKAPAILGGQPAFYAKVPISQPTLPSPQTLIPDFEKTFASRCLTNGQYVRRFEKEVERRLSVKHAVATSSCTSGLLLTLRVLGVRGEVILPSFTFFATAHAAIWNGLTPVFADCDDATFNIAPESVQSLITGRTGAIVGVHVFGNPCRTAELEEIARKHGLWLIFDSAHGLGAIRDGKPVGGFGDAEVFSLSPTKTVVAGEGGVITTNNSWLAERLRIARDYGNAGDYDPDVVGLNARMEEFNAILASASLRGLNDNIAARAAIAALYEQELRGVPGLTFQHIPEENISSYKDFAVLVDEMLFGLGRDQLHSALAAERIMTKTYFSPPVHRQKAYKRYTPKDPRALSATDYVSSRVLCLPIYAHMKQATVSRICAAIRAIHEHAGQIRSSWQEGRAGRRLRAAELTVGASMP